MERNEEIYKFCKEAIAQVAEVPSSSISDTTHFQDDLEMDSLEAVEILHLIEKKYRIKFHDIELEDVQTLKDMYEFVASHLK